MSRSSSSTGFKKGSSRETGYAEFTASSLAVLLLNVAGNVHEEGDWQQEGLHNVGGVEVSTSINLCPLGVVIVEPWMTQNSWHCSKLGPNCPIYCIYIKDIYIYYIYITKETAKELKVAIQTNTEEEHGKERKLVGAEGLQSNACSNFSECMKLSINLC